MSEVIVGVVLTALIGGLLVPGITTWLSQRHVRSDVAHDLLEKLADSLWSYWKLAMRVAYYGRTVDRHNDYEVALEAWDSSKAWSNGARIQAQVSRSKRILPDQTHEALDKAQHDVVDDLDKKVEELRRRADVTAWGDLYDYLYRAKRDEVESLLFSLSEHLDWELHLPITRRVLKWQGRAPRPIPVRESHET